jgi:hypothetical protein
VQSCRRGYYVEQQCSSGSIVGSESVTTHKALGKDSGPDEGHSDFRLQASDLRGHFRKAQGTRGFAGALGADLHVRRAL